MAEIFGREMHASSIHRAHTVATADNFREYLEPEIRSRLDLLHTSWQNFQQVHLALLQTLPTGDERAPFLDSYGEIEGLFLTADAKMKARIAEFEFQARHYDDDVSDHSENADANRNRRDDNEIRRPNDPEVQQARTVENVAAAAAATNNTVNNAPEPLNAQVNQPQVVVQPNVQWPWQFRIENIWGEFDGDRKKWQAFHDSFKSRIHDDPNMPSVQKFQILRTALKGKAAKSLGEWEICDRNYQPAWERLKQLFDDPYTTSKELLNKIFDLKKLDGQNGMKLQIMSNVTQEVSRQLGAMNYPSEHFDMIFIHFVQSKLDQKTSVDWDLERNNNDRPTLNQFTSFLDRQARALNNANTAEMAPKTQKTNEPKRSFNGKGYQNDAKRFKSNQSSNFSTAIKQEKQKCAVCSEEHLMKKCPEFLKLGLTKRKEKVQRAGLCFGCLGRGHSVKDCRANKCSRCEAKHDVLLCPENPTNRHVNAGKVVRKKKSHSKQNNKGKQQ